MCNYLAVTFRICRYAHYKVCPYDTSCEGREMVYFHTNDNGNLCGNNILLVPFSGKLTAPTPCNANYVSPVDLHNVNLR